MKRERRRKRRVALTSDFVIADLSTSPVRVGRAIKQIARCVLQLRLQLWLQLRDEQRACVERDESDRKKSERKDIEARERDEEDRKKWAKRDRNE